MGLSRLRITVGAKLAFPVATAILLTGAAAALAVDLAVHVSLEQELHRRSLATVAELAHRATPVVLEDDVVLLAHLTDDLSSREDIAYAVIIGNDGEVRASSFPTGVPSDLVGIFEQERTDPNDPLSYRSEKGTVRDFVAPMIDGKLGTVHLGVNQERVHHQASSLGRMTMALAALAALISGFLAILAAHRVTRPLRELSTVASRVGTAEPGSLALPKPNDEVGDLARVFEDMLRRLEQKEEQVEIANRLVVQAERMAVVGTLSAGVAHEIGNPLHAARQFLEALRERPEATSRYVGLLDLALTRIDKVITELLGYARERELELRKVEVPKVIDQAMELLRYDHRIRNVRLESEFVPGLPPAWIDADAVQQVLVNLVVNALDAMDGQGGIQITAAPRRDASGQRWVVISLADTGPGVPEDIVPRLFDPFFTTKEPGKGTGLGLSVSHQLVAAQGGRLEYAAQEGRGACFEIHLRTREET